MATFLGGTYLPQKERRDSNFPILAQIMQLKQQKYDANRAKVQQTLDSFGIMGQQVLRDEDKEYIAAKLTDITNQVNGYGNKDLSQSGVTESLDSKIKMAAADPFIQSAIQNTQKYNRFQQDVAKIKEKNPELYSDINYQYALKESGIDKYLKGEQNEIGDLVYTPYNDYDKKINDNIIDLLGKQGKRTVQTRVLDAQGNPTGELQEIEIDGLSPDQLRSVAASMLAPNDLKQIEIDGWYSNGGYENPAIMQQIKGGLGAKLSKLDENILLYDKKLKEAGSTSEKNKYSSMLNEAKSEKTRIQKNLETLTSNPKAASTFLEREKVIDNITARFAPLYTQSNSIVKDEAYWARMNYNLALAKEQREAAEALAKNNGNIGGLSVVSLSTELADLPEIESAVQSQLDDVSTELDVTLKQYKYALEQEAGKGNKSAVDQLNLLNSKLQSRGKTSETDIIREMVLSTDSTNDPLVLTNDKGENIRSKVRQLSDEFLLYSEGYEQAKKKAKDAHIDLTLNNEETFRAFYKNKNTNMLWNGKSVPVYKVLQQAGVMDANGKKIGNLKESPEALKELMKSYYASDIINDLTGLTSASDKFKANESLSSLAISFGENPSDVLKEYYTGSTIVGDYYGKVLNPNTKTGQYLLQARQNGIYDRFDFSDQDLSSDDATIGKFITDDYRQQPTYIQDLNRFRQKLANQQQVGISYNTDKAMYSDLLRTAQNKNPYFLENKAGTITIRKAGNEVVIEQKNKDTDKKDKGISEARLSLDEFVNNFPELYQRLDFSSNAAIYTYDRLQGRPLVSEPIKYIDKSSADLYSYSTKVLLKDRPMWAKYLTKEDSKSSLVNENIMLSKQLPQFQEIVNEAIDESGNYGVNINITAKFGEPEMYLSLIDKKSKETIHSISLQGVTAVDDFKSVLDDAPQVYYSLLLDDIFKRQAYSIGTSGSITPSYTKLIKSLNER